MKLVLYFPATAWLPGGEPGLAQIHSLPGLLLRAVTGSLFGLLAAGRCAVLDFMHQPGLGCRVGGCFPDDLC